MTEAEDKRVIACNYLKGTKSVSKGSLCYVVGTSGAAERINILVRPRGGRWIKKWESFKRLGNFRAKTVPAQHSRYGDDRIFTYTETGLESDLDWFRQIKVHA